MSNSLGPHGLKPAKLLGPWDSPGKNTGLGCHGLLQGIFLSLMSPSLTGGFFTISATWEASPVFLPGESHGPRSLAGYSPWHCKKSDMTEVT